MFALVLATALSATPETMTREDTVEWYQQHLMEWTNARRYQPLKRHPALDRAAQAYAERMARTGCFDHYGCGSSPSGRARAAGWTGSYVSENIAYNYGGHPRFVINAQWGYMSGAHSSNLLGGWRYCGHGAAQRNGRIYYVAMYGN